MDINVLKEIAYKLMGNRKAQLEREKGFIFYHGLRVSKLSLNLRKVILKEDSSHDDIITVASLFHDVAKGIEPHGKNGAVLVKDILRDYCSEDEINEIADIIYYHSLRKKNNDYSEYIKIVQDSDMLDHFGSMDVWLSFQHCAYKDEPIQKALAFFNNEYNAEVQKCRALLNYDVSCEIFDNRVSFTNLFVDRLRREEEGEICIKI